MNKEIPDHQIKAVKDTLRLLSEALPDMFQVTPDGVVFTNPNNLSIEDIFSLAEENRPGVIEETSAILEAGKHPDQ